MNRKIPVCFRYVTLLLLLFPGTQLMAQAKAIYNYQDLSHIFYARQKDSIKKSWACPALYKERETQKKYKEIWDSRTSFITEAIEQKGFIKDDELYMYIQAIVNDITKSNPSYFSKQPTLLLDRSASVNAYTFGRDFIAVNAGLVSFASCREEIALVIAHELSHNYLQHTDNAIKEKAEWLTSDEYKRSLNSILDSKYERLSRLKKIFENYSFSRSRHNRYHEGDADSLALLLLRNSHIPFNAKYFLRLDSADIQYKTPLKNPVKSYFAAYGIPVEDSWTQKRTRGLSTKSYNFRDTTGLADSLKTHPDCRERYEKTLAFSSEGKETPVPSNIKDKANKILIWNIFDNQGLTACLYRILLEKDKGSKDEWYDFMVHNILSGLFYSDKQLNRFNAIGVTQKEFISKDYYELQNLFEQMPRENLEQACKQIQTGIFWQQISSDGKALKALFSTLNFDAAATDKTKERAARDFIEANPSSMYCEFAEHFKK
jgi:Peptidase family M48